MCLECSSQLPTGYLNEMLRERVMEVFINGELHIIPGFAYESFTFNKLAIIYTCPNKIPDTIKTES